MGLYALLTMIVLFYMHTFFKTSEMNSFKRKVKVTSSVDRPKICFLLRLPF